MTLKDQARIMIVDDSMLQCAVWQRLFTKRYGAGVVVETYTDPKLAIAALAPTVELLLVDWEMPGADGHAVVAAAKAAGVDSKRIIVLSGRTADELHASFDECGCLAVIEKDEPEQQLAFMMILDSVIKRCVRSTVPQS